MAYGYGPLQRYKTKMLYRRVKRMRRQLGNVRKYKEQFVKDNPQGQPNSIATFGQTWATASDQQKIARRALRYYGPGDYRSFLGKIIPQGSFSYLGRTLGGMTGVPGMNAVGAYAGSKFANLVGFGDYGTSANQIVDGTNKGQISVNDSDMTGDVYITQTEFIQNISCSATAAGASAFQIVQFPLNPGIVTTFPFLSQIAQNYTLYEFEGLVFKFNPTSGENNATSNSLGKVILATNYDPNSSAFVNSVQMENYDYANAAKPSQTIVHGVETANHQQALNMQYIRTGATTRDKVFFDIGNLFVATEGIPFAAAGTQILGELWVTYRVKLSRANLYSSLLGTSISQDSFLGNWPTHASGFTSTAKSTNQIGCVVTTSAANTILITFPVNISLGSYLLSLQCISGATGFTNQILTGPVGTNMTFWTPQTALPSATAVNRVGPEVIGGAPTNTGILANQWFTISAPGSLQATLSWTASAALSNTTTYRLFITQVNQGPSLVLT